MTDEELVALTDAEITNSISFMGGKLSEERRRNLYYYLGKPVEELAPPAIPGRSRVVSTDVADTIEWMLPSLLKIFTAGDNAVEFAPQGPEDEKAAKQATDYVNYVFYRQNQGFKTLYSWFKDALLQKNGIVKVWWDDSKDESREEYLGQTMLDLQLLAQDESVEIIESTEREPDENEMAGVQQMLATNPEIPPTVFDVTVRKRKSAGKICHEPVPPEEFLMSRQGRSITDTPFCGHRFKRTLSQLKASGYKNVDDLMSDTNGLDNMERTERRSIHDDWVSDMDQSNSSDKSQRTVWVTECYLQVDWDKDGIAEWRKVVRCGHTVLENEAIDEPPFVSLTPIPIPHEFFGLCPADQAIESQRLKTSLQRAVSDNIYLQTNGRYFAVDGQVNLDDLLTNRPGGVVRMKAPGMAGALDQGHGDLAGTMAYLEYVEQQKENRTGFTRYSQGANGDSLNQTATGVSIITNKADSRIELIARVFAETGVTDLFKMILKLVSKYQQEAQVVRLNGEWVQMDPREWKTQFDVTINVGLGTGNKDQAVQHLMILSQAQIKGLDLGVATPENVYNGFTEIAKNMGFSQTDKFFTNPHKMPPKQPQQDPKIAVAQINAQSKAQTTDMQIKGNLAIEHVQAQTELEKAAISHTTAMTTNHQSNLAQVAQTQHTNESNAKSKDKDNWASITQHAADVELGREQGDKGQDAIKELAQRVQQLESLLQSQQGRMQ